MYGVVVLMRSWSGVAWLLHSVVVLVFVPSNTIGEGSTFRSTENAIFIVYSGPKSVGVYRLLCKPWTEQFPSLFWAVDRRCLLNPASNRGCHLGRIGTWQSRVLWDININVYKGTSIRWRAYCFGHIVMSGNYVALNSLLCVINPASRYAISPRINRDMLHTKNIGTLYNLFQMLLSSTLQGMSFPGYLVKYTHCWYLFGRWVEILVREGDRMQNIHHLRFALCSQLMGSDIPLPSRTLPIPRSYTSTNGVPHVVMHISWKRVSSKCAIDTAWSVSYSQYGHDVGHGELCRKQAQYMIK